MPATATRFTGIYRERTNPKRGTENSILEGDPRYSVALADHYELQYRGIGYLEAYEEKINLREEGSQTMTHGKSLSLRYGLLFEANLECLP